MSLWTPFKGKTKEEFKLHRKKSTEFLLCNNCGWNASLNEHYLYCSHVKVMCNGNRGMWFIGDKYFIKEIPLVSFNRHAYHGPDAQISRFLEKNTTVPVAKEMRTWQDSKSIFEMMTRMEGETLAHAQANGRYRTAEAYTTFAREVVQYILQIRKFTSPRIEDTDGTPLRDRWFSSGQRVELVANKEEWWARTEPRIKPSFSEEWKKDFKERYPLDSSGPYVLTHGDLNDVNIFVKDGHICGIIDWEHGGYKPDWIERASLNNIEEVNWFNALEAEFDRQGITDTTCSPEWSQFYRDFMSAYKDYDREYIEWEKFDADIWRQCPNFQQYLDTKDANFEGHQWARRRLKKIKRGKIKITKFRTDRDSSEIYKVYQALSDEDKQEFMKKRLQMQLDELTDSEPELERDLTGSEGVGTQRIDKELENLEI